MNLLPFNNRLATSWRAERHVASLLEYNVMVNGVGVSSKWLLAEKSIGNWKSLPRVTEHHERTMLGIEVLFHA